MNGGVQIFKAVDRIRSCAAIALLMGCACAAMADNDNRAGDGADTDSPKDRIARLDRLAKWNKGPMNGDIGSIATVKVPPKSVGAATFTIRPNLLGVRKLQVAGRDAPGGMAQNFYR